MPIIGINMYVHIYVYIYIYIHTHTHTPVHIYVFSHSVVSDSLRPHGLQHASLPCLSPTPGAYSNSCLSS